MADPFYLQGTQTGSLLQNLQQQQQQQNVPQGTYTPGMGQAPMAAPQQTSSQAIDAVIKAAAPYGQGAVQKAVAAFNSGQTYNPATGQSAPMTPQEQQSAGFTTVGQGEAWLTPDQLKAKTQGLTTGLGGGGGSGGGSGSGSAATAGGSGGGGSTAGGSSGGLNLGNIGEAPPGATPQSLQQTSTPTGPTVGYQNPGTVNNTATVGYINPGSTNSAGGAGVLQMQQPNGQSALDAYKATPGYQLLNAPGAYQQSPGYQYAMDQAMQQVQQGASARGMLESGAVLKSMQQTASGLAQQDYGNWWNRQNQLYGDYQNRLQGLAGGPTGSADAMTAGTNAAQANLQTGSNLGSLFSGQGAAGMGGIINTAAAQSGNMINAGQQQASVNAANQSTQLAGATLAGNQNKGLF